MTQIPLTVDKTEEEYNTLKDFMGALKRADKRKRALKYTELPKWKAWVAGGAILSENTGMPTNDIDVYPMTEQAGADIRKDLFSAGFTLADFSTKAATFVRSRHKTYDGTIIQVMHHLDCWPSSTGLIDAFDFTVCKAAYSLVDRDYHYHDKYHKDVMSRRLRIDKEGVYPIRSLLRVQKYEKKGYTMCDTDRIALILNAIDACDIFNWRDLEDSIGGMYGRSVNLAEDNEEFSMSKAIKVLLEFDEDTVKVKPNVELGTVYEIPLNVLRFIQGGTPLLKDDVVERREDKHSVGVVRYKDNRGAVRKATLFDNGTVRKHNEHNAPYVQEGTLLKALGHTVGEYHDWLYGTDVEDEDILPDDTLFYSFKYVVPQIRSSSYEYQYVSHFDDTYVYTKGQIHRPANDYHIHSGLFTGKIGDHSMSYSNDNKNHLIMVAFRAKDIMEISQNHYVKVRKLFFAGTVGQVDLKDTKGAGLLHKAGSTNLEVPADAMADHLRILNNSDRSDPQE